MMPLWFVLALLALFVIHGYIAARTAGILRMKRRGFVIILAVLSVGPVLYMLSRGESPTGFWMVARLIGATSTLGVLIAFGLLLPVDLLLGLGTVAFRIRKYFNKRRLDLSVADGLTSQRSAPSANKISAPDHIVDLHSTSDSDSEGLLPRRSFLKDATRGAAILTGAGASLYGITFGRRDYRVEEHIVRLPNLPRELEGYTIVQLSDIHIGSFIGERELASATDLVRTAGADAVVLTGDLLDHDPRYAPKLGAWVQDLNEVSREGVFAIVGNHDHYAGVPEVVHSLERGGAEVLVNRGVTLGDSRDKIALLGVDDVWARRSGVGGPDLNRALEDAPPGAPKILLCHNPSFFPEAAPHVDLQLSGHTHGGQVQLGINPAAYVLPFGYVAGEYSRDGARLYVNRGFGTAGPPARVGSPPEITRIVLVRG